MNPYGLRHTAYAGNEATEKAHSTSDSEVDDPTSCRVYAVYTNLIATQHTKHMDDNCKANQLQSSLSKLYQLFSNNKQNVDKSDPRDSGTWMTASWRNASGPNRYTTLTHRIQYQRSDQRQVFNSNCNSTKPLPYTTANVETCEPILKSPGIMTRNEPIRFTA